MGLTLKPRQLKRYGEMARLLAKHGGTGLLDDVRGELPPAGLELEEDGAPRARGRPEELADDLERMGPTFIKLGQVLSSRPDLLPAPYLEALERLQDRVEPFPAEEAVAILEEELGTRVSRAFRTFDREPIAAASLGQVHRATLRDGREVAVKVRRPGILDGIQEDLEALERLADALDRHTSAGRKYAFGDMLEQFRGTLLRELDYRQEAANLATLAENLSSHPELFVPRAIDDFTTPRVLTMEYVRGTKVSELPAVARTERDLRPLAEALVEAYLDQILADGFFHADPHPGNAFFTEDGRLALIDLGMVQRIEPSLRRQLLKVVLAVSDGRGREAADLGMQLAVRLREADPRGYRRAVAEVVGRFGDARIGELQVGRVLMEVSRLSAEHGFRQPPELTVLGKTLLHLDGVARALDPELDANQVVRRYAGELLQRHVLRAVTPEALFSTALEAGELVERLPGRLNAILQALAENRFRVSIDAVDEERLIHSLKNIANRITAGLVLAALILGAALLMRVDTPFTILGYPGLAMIFFLLAAGAGFVLVLSIFFDDRRGAGEEVEG